MALVMVSYHLDTFCHQWIHFLLLFLIILDGFSNYMTQFHLKNMYTIDRSVIELLKNIHMAGQIKIQKDC